MYGAACFKVWKQKEIDYIPLVCFCLSQLSNICDCEHPLEAMFSYGTHFSWRHDRQRKKFGGSL